ncbi:MAG: hypothetical protein QNJ27_03890, partial [Simkaniaceae bacterium]|nr:hypothetical protein [Simkaniaceae bacterium]
NEWIHDNSGGKISRFIDPTTLAKSTKIILIPFLLRAPGIVFFQPVEVEPVNPRMMNQKSCLYYFKNKDTQIIALPIEKEGADPVLPKFMISQKLDLNALFRTLGVNSALNTNANFSEIDGKEEFCRYMNVNRPFFYAIYAFDTDLFLFLRERLNPLDYSNVVNREKILSHERLYL